jgi:hypothetical protein
MTTSQAALEHLRVIRSLLEKAQVYRAVSAPAALVGGVLSLAASGWTVKVSQIDFSGRVEEGKFLAIWLGILAITSALNFALLAKQAAKRSQPFFSEGMRTALRSFLPPMLAGGVLGICLIWYNDEKELAALVWILCYGLALLATGHFSPRSLIRLGWAFLISGIVLTLWWSMSGGLGFMQNNEVKASLFLGLTFGLLHVLYAIAVFISRKPAAEIPVG